LPAAVHLLEAGAKVDLHNCKIAAENEACASPLHIAVLMGHTEIVNLLIE
jgi:ankyrin repeat protein